MTQKREGSGWWWVAVWVAVVAFFLVFGPIGDNEGDSGHPCDDDPTACMVP